MGRNKGGKGNKHNKRHPPRQIRKNYYQSLNSLRKKLCTL